MLMEAQKCIAFITWPSRPCWRCGFCWPQHGLWWALGTRRAGLDPAIVWLVPVFLPHHCCRSTWWGLGSCRPPLQSVGWWCSHGCLLNSARSCWRLRTNRATCWSHAQSCGRRRSYCSRWRNTLTWTSGYVDLFHESGPANVPCMYCYPTIRMDRHTNQPICQFNCCAALHTNLTWLDSPQFPACYLLGFTHNDIAKVLALKHAPLLAHAALQ